MRSPLFIAVIPPVPSNVEGSEVEGRSRATRDLLFFYVRSPLTTYT